MKTQPMAHQLEGQARLDAAPEAFALGAEQGTGKTWMLLNDAERQFNAGRIQALLVLAPKGVHTNWVLREIPTHLSVPHVADYWLAGLGKRRMARLQELLTHDPGERLVVLAMNIDAVNVKKGFEFAREFLRTYKTMMVIDESQRIQNPDSKRTQRVKRLGTLAASRRIASGTLVSNSPLSLYGQYDFLGEGLLGTTSYRAYVAEYAELLPQSSPLIREMKERCGARGRFMEPQIVKTDVTGLPIYRNLEKLRDIIAPHTFRVLKEDCLDLPEKIYKTRYFELEPKHRALYEQISDEMRYERDDGDIDIYTSLTMINKLRQVVSGFILVDGEPTELVYEKNKMETLFETINDEDGPFIIWASFRQELEMIAAMLKQAGRSVVQYHGGISADEREEAVDKFQRGEVEFFVANPAAGGTGITLTRAKTAIYYSCSFSFEQRAQSEDRCHRIGTRHNVVYVDIVGADTIDERIARSLQAKEGTAKIILDFV